MKVQEALAEGKSGLEFLMGVAADVQALGEPLDDSLFAFASSVAGLQELGREFFDGVVHGSQPGQREEDRLGRLMALHNLAARILLAREAA